MSEYRISLQTISYIIQWGLTLFFLTVLADMYMSLFDRPPPANIIADGINTMNSGLTISWVFICSHDLLTFLFEKGSNPLRRVLQPLKAVTGWYLFRAIFIIIRGLRTPQPFLVPFKNRIYVNEE